MRISPLLLLISIFTVVNSMLFAQGLDFAHLNVENGLSQKSVLAITQDSRGFLWFGTANGLNRYDSRNFKSYLDSQSKNGLASGYILSLFVDKAKNLWVGTANGVYIYQEQTDDFKQINLPAGADHKASRIINCITEDNQNRIWIGTTNGLYLLNSPSDKNPTLFYANNTGIAGNNIHSLAADAANIWVGTDNGLTRIMPQQNTFKFETYRHNNNQLGSIGDNNVSSIVLDENHTIWIGLHEKGLESFDSQTKTFVHYSNPLDDGTGSGNIRQVISNGEGKLWLGTQDGLSLFDTRNKRFITYKHDPNDLKSLNQNSIYSVFIDQHKTLWVGTYFGGINIATASIFKKYQSNSDHTGISNDVVSSIVEDRQHHLWIGTEGGGLNYVDQKGKKIITYQHQKNNPASISSNLIKVVFLDKDGLIWAGSHGGGLNVLQPGQNSFKKYFYRENDAETASSEIRAITEDAVGHLWVGTNTGIKILNKDKDILTTFPNATAISGVLQNQPINCIYTDLKNRIWVGSWGMFVSEDTNSSIKSLPVQSDLLGRAKINCINGDADGNIWFGSDLKGLFKYDPASKRLYNYTENDGLANNNVYGIVQDERGTMWISTGNGLSNFNTKTGTFHNYTTRDGLAGNDFNKNAFARLSDGEILFGGFNGFTGFYPVDIKETQNTPTAYIIGLKLFNKPVHAGDENQILSTDISQSKAISFKYDQNVFTIDFVILNYIRAERNKYAYQIEDIDQGWNYTNIPSATYNNLPPGKYHFSAKGRNNDGVWSMPVSLIIVVYPPWWRTWWAYSFYVMLLAGIVFLIVRYFFLQALLKKDHELTELKLNFFNNISHEIRTYLSLISAPVEKLLIHKQVDDTDVPQLQTIKKNSDELLQLVNELMDFRKAETGNLTLHVSCFNIIPFIQSVCESFQDISLSRNILTEFVTDSEIIDLYFDKEQMKKVIFNLLSNAYKFTPNGGRVAIFIEDQGTSINIKIADTGKGISSENIQKLFNNYFQEHDYGSENTGYGVGLALSKSIVELHKGELKVESGENNEDQNFNTVFTLTLYKGDKHFAKDQITQNPSFNIPENKAESELAIPLAIANTANKDTYLKYSVLVVEDNSDVRKFIVDSLKQSYHILEAANGAEGFEIAAEHIPDLIISDVMMPEMDGYTFCRKIKTDERTDHIPVILLTAKASVPNQINGLEMGADVYLTKPFSIQILELQVQNLIAGAEKLRLRYSRQIIALPQSASSITTDGGLTEPPSGKEHIVENEFINKIIAMTGEHISDPNFDIEMICRNIGMSRNVLYKKVKALTDLTINDLVKDVRFKKAAELLSQKKYTVYEVADMVGYNDTKYFSREFKKQFGISPRDFKMENTNQ